MGDYPSSRVGTRVINRCPHCGNYMVQLNPRRVVVNQRTGEARTIWTCVQCRKDVK